jgi:DNA-binding CsgD family transcriptional regulator
MVAVEIRSAPTSNAAGRRGRRPDPMSVLDAAYDLNCDDVVWLTGVAHAMYPFLDRGFGTHSFLYRLAPSAASLEVHTAVLLNCPPGLREALAACTDRVNPAELSALYHGPPCQSLSQVFAKVAPGRPYAEFAAARHMADQIGAVDQLGVIAVESDGIGCGFAGLCDRVMRFPPRSAGVLSRVARHVAAARRLRSALVRSEDARVSLDVDAVLTETGAVLHAESEAKGAGELPALSTAAKTLGESRARFRKSDPEQAVRLWTALIRGKWSLVSTRDSDGKRFLVARRNAPELGDPAALRPDERQVVALAARGHSVKLIAYELGLSKPTVSVRLTRALRKLGLASRAELAHWLGS